MLYVIHVVGRLISDALGVLFVRMASVLGRSLENSLATPYSRRLTSRMMARAGAGGNCVVFPEDQRKAEDRKLSMNSPDSHLKRTCTSKAFHSQEIMCSR